MFALANSGCSNLVKFAVEKTQPQGNKIHGIVYYLGGAGPVGNIGSFDIPRGLRRAGFQGHVEVFPWQTISHATDQIFIARNRDKAQELAQQIRRDRRLYPDAPIHIIALSAGTGVATFALEYLPESIDIESVYFLGCSMSSQYDMTRALSRIRGRLYVLHSPGDEMLKNVVWYTGTVDRTSSEAGIAGLEGFYTPKNGYPDTVRQYHKLINIPYRTEFSDAGYDGGHTSATNASFVQYYIGPSISGNSQRLIGDRKLASPRIAAPPVIRTRPSPTSEPSPTNTEPIAPPWTRSLPNDAAAAETESTNNTQPDVGNDPLRPHDPVDQPEDDSVDEPADEIDEGNSTINPSAVRRTTDGSYDEYVDEEGNK